MLVVSCLDLLLSSHNLTGSIF